MKLHEVEIIARATNLKGAPLTLWRRAVPGGWIYTEVCYMENSRGAVASASTSTAFVPDVRDDRVEAVVQALLREMGNRRGFAQVWAGLTPEGRTEMTAALEKRVREAL